MLGTNYDNETNIIVGSKSNSSLQNQTGNNQYVDPKIVEDEIALSEHLRKDAEKVKKRDSVNDIVEDFENYSDDGFDNVDKLDNDIVDEVGDDDAMKMLEEAAEDVKAIQELITACIIRQWLDLYITKIVVELHR